LAEIKNVSWVNLCVDKRPENDHAIALLQMADLTSEFGDFSDTAGAIDALDGVVAIDCSVAHVAASLGKTVWLLTSTSLEWRWRIGDDTNPFWPTVKTYQCDSIGVWDTAIRKLASDLVNESARRTPGG